MCILKIVKKGGYSDIEYVPPHGPLEYMLTSAHKYCKDLLANKGILYHVHRPCQEHALGVSKSLYIVHFIIIHA